MKKAMLTLLMCAMLVGLFMLAACQDQKLPPTPTVENTEPIAKLYTLARTKQEIPADTQMTPENIEDWLEQYTTTNETDAQNIVRWAQIESIQYQWTKQAIPSGTLINASMFTNVVPDGVIPPDPSESLTYDKYYAGVLDTSGLTLEIPAADLLEQLPEGVTGKQFQVEYINIKVIDRDEENADAQYNEQLNGVYNLKHQTGDVKFTVTSSGINLDGLGLLLGNTEFMAPAMIYYTYHQQDFNDPVVQISCTITVDNKPYPVMLGGEFEMCIDEASGLNPQILMSTAEQIFSGSMGGGFAEWLDGIIGLGGAGLGT